MQIRTLDLFAGIGGFRLAFENVGFQTVYANDMAKRCEKVYNSNFGPPHLVIGDIRDFPIDELPAFDVMTGGFPCQPFSAAGFRLGFSDSRGLVIFHIIEILSRRQPRAFLFENVKRLLTHDNGECIKVIVGALRDIGYSVEYRVLDSCKYANIPQHRERLFIVGFQDPSLMMRFNWPPEISLTCSFRDFLIENVPDNFYPARYNPKYIPQVQRALAQHSNSPDTTFRLKKDGLRPFKTLRVVPTITSTFSAPVIIVNNDMRRLTGYECLRLQGFPDSYKCTCCETDLREMAGNSVCVPLVQILAQSIFDLLTTI